MQITWASGEQYVWQTSLKTRDEKMRNFVRTSSSSWSADGGNDELLPDGKFIQSVVPPPFCFDVSGCGSIGSSEFGEASLIGRSWSLKEECAGMMGDWGVRAFSWDGPGVSSICRCGGSLWPSISMERQVASGEASGLRLEGRSNKLWSSVANSEVSADLPIPLSLALESGSVMDWHD